MSWNNVSYYNIQDQFSNGISASGGGEGSYQFRINHEIKTNRAQRLALVSRPSDSQFWFQRSQWFFPRNTRSEPRRGVENKSTVEEGIERQLCRKFLECPLHRFETIARNFATKLPNDRLAFRFLFPLYLLGDFGKISCYYHHIFSLSKNTFSIYFSFVI